MKKLLLMLLFIFAGTIFAVKPETPPGAGTKDSPYQLSKYEHLLWIGNPITNNYVYATLTADIDASVSTSITNFYNEPTPYFNGSFDGQGHTISDLCRIQEYVYWYYDWDDNIVYYTNYYETGFFSEFIGECRNLNLEGNTNSWSPCRFAGEFWGPGDDELGTAENIRLNNARFSGDFYGTVENIHVTNGGEFAGEFGGTASNIQISGSIYTYDEDEEWWYGIGSDFAEDFYGTAESIQISDGALFAWWAEDSVIRNVTAHDSSVLFSAYYTLIEMITVDGDINLSGSPFYEWEDFGGCVGYTRECTIRNVAVTANISGGYYFDSTAGVVGWDGGGESTISNCYFSGKIRSANADYVGGIAGYTYGGETYIKDCYYDLTGAPLKSSYYGTPVFPEELRMKKTFQNWDFENVWNIEEGISTPTLKVIDKDGFEMIVADGLSKTTVSLKGTLTDEDVKAIQDSSEICLYSTGSGLEITARQTLDETALQVFSFKKKEEATISYKGKNKAFKFSSPVPSITVGKKSGSSFSPCTLSGSKMKLNSSARLFKDVSDYFKKDNASVSLCDLEMADSVLEGTAVKLTQKGKNLSYKSNETGVMLSVKVNPTKKTVTVKYTGENYVQPTIWRDTKKR